MSTLRRFFSLSILIMFAMPFPLVQSLLSVNKTNAFLHHICINNEGKSKTKSYDNSVKDFLGRLIGLMPPEYGYGFHSGVSGTGPDEVYGKVQCRGDVSESECSSCLHTASSSILKKCPNNKGRIIWYDNCLLSLSSIYNFKAIDYRHNFYLHNSKDVTSDTMSFNKKTSNLLNKLKEKATSEENNIPETKEYMYVNGEENLGKVKLYAMMQCTQDLSFKNCSVCLDWIMTKLPKCCNNKQGGRVLSASCNFRYELYPFVKT
ncbi:unnamed protein product [Cochlearia groenlandica]